MQTVLLLFLAVAASASDFQPRIIKSELTSASTIDGHSVVLEKGVIAVPNNRSNPAYMINLPYYRLRSLASEPGAPVFYLAGGPGNPGLPRGRSYLIDYASFLLKHSDVIFFDQRGTGKSEPDLRFRAPLDIPVEISISDPEFAPIFREQISERIHQVVAETGIDFSDYNTAENANDLDDLRKLLGYEKLILWGHSYGSHLGMAYIHQYETSVEKAIFSGSNGLNDRYRLPSESEPAIDRLNSYIQNDAYYRQQIPDVRQLIRRICDELRTQPRLVKMEYKQAYNYENRGIGGKIAVRLASLFQDSIAVKIGEGEFKAYLMLMMQGTLSLYQVPQVLLQINSGDYSPIARRVKPFINQGGRNSPIAQTAMTYAMAIASHATDEKLLQVNSEIANTRHTFTNVLNFPFLDITLHEELGVQYLPDSFRTLRVYKTPVLFLNGDLDIRTPLEHMQRNARHFPNATLRIVQNASHTFYPLRDGVLQTMIDFIAGNALEEEQIRIGRTFLSPVEESHREQLTKMFADGEQLEFEVYAREHHDEINEFTLNAIGYLYMNRKQYDKALQIFKLNVELFPDASNPWDSLGEAYFNLHEDGLAAQHYQKSIDLNMMNRNAYSFLKQIKTRQTQATPGVER